MNGTGRCLQIGTDTICGIQCDCLCHSTLHRWKQYFGLYNLVRTHGRCQQSGICTDIRKYVFIAGLCGLCAIRKIFIDDDAGSSIAVTYTWNCQLAGLSTNRYLYDARRFVEIFIFQILMNPAHDFGPQLLMETCLSCLTAQFMLVTVVVISYPDACRIIRRHADEPYVTILGSGTGFTGSSHIADLGCTGRSACTGDYIFHTVDQKPCILLRDHLCRLLHRIIKDHITFIVHDLRVQLRLIIRTSICYSRIGCGQLQIGYAIGQSAKGHCLTGIGVCSIQLQTGESEAEQIIYSHTRSDIRNRLDCHDIHGTGNRFTKRRPSSVLSLLIPVID